jgi:hypothetical protein
MNTVCIFCPNFYRPTAYRSHEPLRSTVYLLPASDSGAFSFIAPRLPGVVGAASRALVRQDVELHVRCHSTIVAEDPYLTRKRVKRDIITAG